MLGSEFIRRSSGVNSNTLQDVKASEALCKRLNGHPLALTQMSALARTRKWKLDKMLSMYDRSPKKLHSTFDARLLHAGYSFSISTVFLMSFKSVLHPDQDSPGANSPENESDQRGTEAMLLLGIMSFLNPDSIQEDLFELSEDVNVPPEMIFLTEELE